MTDEPILPGAFPGARRDLVTPVEGRCCDVPAGFREAADADTLASLPSRR